MLAARQLEIVENCYKRSYRPYGANGNISSEVINRLTAFAIPAYYPKGAVFFVEGQPSRGVFILYSGRFKLFHVISGWENRHSKVCRSGGNTWLGWDAVRPAL
jgi:hypothetical protein